LLSQQYILTNDLAAKTENDILTADEIFQ
jgi:hypothetical protein